MNLALTVIAIGIWSWLAVIWFRRIKARREFERLSITPEQLHELIATNKDVLILDVRQPLDLLADSEIIEGAQRISPEEAAANPASYSDEQGPDCVLYLPQRQNQPRHRHEGAEFGAEY